MTNYKLNCVIEGDPMAKGSQGTWIVHYLHLLPFGTRTIRGQPVSRG